MATTTDYSYSYDGDWYTPPPASGGVRLDGPSTGALSKGMVSTFDAGGADLSAALLATPVGSDFYLWQKSNNGNFGRWPIQGVVAKAGYVEFDLGAAAATGGTIQNGPCTLQLEVGGLPAESVAAFQLYVYRDGVRDIKVGFAPDVQSAATLAGAWLSTAEQLYPTQGVAIGIVNTKTDLVVASTGWIRGGKASG